MATWAEFEAAEPEMAALARTLLSNQESQIGYLATVRKDGGPRVHPVCPVIAGSNIYLAISAHSRKLADLRRDGRYMLHAMPGKDDAEFSLRGRATLANDTATHAGVERAATSVGLNFNAGEVIFRLEIEAAATAHWVNVGQPGTYAVRRRWRA